MKVEFVKPDLGFVSKTFKDLGSLEAWKKNRWFHHLGAVVLIVLFFNGYGKALKELTKTTWYEHLVYSLWDMSFIETWLAQSLFYSVFFAVGFEFLQMLYIVLKENRFLKKEEVLASMKDIVATSLFFFIVALIIIPIFR